MEQTLQNFLGERLSFRNFFLWAWLVVKEPRRFFAGVSKTGGYGVPVLYALVWSFLSALLSFVVSYARPDLLPAGMFRKVLLVLLDPLLTVATGFVLSGVFFVIWHLMGSKEDYKTAFRCWAAMVPPISLLGAVLMLLPWVKFAVVLVYGGYLLVVASMQAHGIPKQRSWLVWSGVSLSFLILVGVFEMGRVSQGRPADRSFSSEQ
jgi:hypothetical protein